MKAIYERFNKTGAAYGLEFNPVEFLPNTNLALIATELARDKGLFEEFHALVFKSYFTYGKDIGNKDVLIELLRALNIPSQVAIAALEDSSYSERVKKNREKGIPYQVTGLPTFIFDGTHKIVGAQSYDMFKRTLDKLS